METKELTNGLLKGKMSDAMVWRGAVSNGTDLNEIRTAGIYLINVENYLNGPGVTAGSIRGILRVTNGYPADNKYLLQEVILTTGIICSRVFWWNSWSVWNIPQST